MILTSRLWITGRVGYGESEFLHSTATVPYSRFESSRVQVHEQRRIHIICFISHQDMALRSPVDAYYNDMVALRVVRIVAAVTKIYLHQPSPIREYHPPQASVAATPKIN